MARARVWILGQLDAERSRWMLWLPVAMGLGIAVYFELPSEPALWLGPGLAGAAFVLVFLATATELTATLLLAPTGTETLATAFWAASDELDYVASAPYAAVLILLSAPLTLLLHRRMAAVA